MKKNAFIKIIWCVFEKVILPKISRFWLKFGFLLPKDMVLGLIQKAHKCWRPKTTTEGQLYLMEAHNEYWSPIMATGVPYSVLEAHSGYLKPIVTTRGKVYLLEFHNG